MADTVREGKCVISGYRSIAAGKTGQPIRSPYYRAASEYSLWSREKQAPQHFPPVNGWV